MGLARLHRHSFDAAAQAFLRCADGIGSAYNDVIHNDDVAVGATLCALASLDRGAGKRQVRTVHLVPLPPPPAALRSSMATPSSRSRPSGKSRAASLG